MSTTAYAVVGGAAARLPSGCCVGGRELLSMRAHVAPCKVHKRCHHTAMCSCACACRRQRARRCFLTRTGMYGPLVGFSLLTPSGASASGPSPLCAPLAPPSTTQAAQLRHQAGFTAQTLSLAQSLLITIEMLQVGAKEAAGKMDQADKDIETEVGACVRASGTPLLHVWHALSATNAVVASALPLHHTQWAVMLGSHQDTLMGGMMTRLRALNRCGTCRALLAMIASTPSCAMPPAHCCTRVLRPPLQWTPKQLPYNQHRGSKAHACQCNRGHMCGAAGRCRHSLCIHRAWNGQRARLR